MRRSAATASALVSCALLALAAYLSPSDRPLKSSLTLIPTSSSTQVTYNEDPFAPRPTPPHASLRDLSQAAVEISKNITECESDSACIATTLMMNVANPLDVVAAFSHATSSDSPAANQCHAPSHQLGRALRVADVASSSFLSVCSDGLLHGLFETWGSLRTLDQVVREFPSLCQTLVVNSCAHVAGHALSKASDATVPKALAACAVLGIDAMGCSSGVVMLVFDALRSGANEPSIAEIDAVCKEFSLPARLDCEGELPWQWELSGLSWPDVITKCENVSKEGRRSCARGSGRLAYQGSLASPELTVSRCKMSLSQDITESCLGSAASEVGKNSGTPNPALVCNAAGDLRSRCLELVDDYS